MPVAPFHPIIREWFATTFPAPTRAQTLAWPPIARGESTLLLAPTGSGKTLAAFLWCLDRLMFSPAPAAAAADRCRVIYVSPLKALASDVERNLQVPLHGIAAAARRHGVEPYLPAVAIRSGDTPPRERARFARHAADILITTPESLYLLLTSEARVRLTAVETVIVDEIHALVPGKRGAHLALSLERLEALREGRRDLARAAPGRRGRAPGGTSRVLQRIGLSATQRPAGEAAHFLGGALVAPDAGHRRQRRGRGTPAAGAHPGTPAVGTHAGTPADSARPAANVHDEFSSADVAPTFRPVTIVDALEPKRLQLTVEVPAEALLAAHIDRPAGRAPAAGRRRPRSRPPGGSAPSIWGSVHPRLLALIRSHHSTLIFVNNRRLAERLADALNTLAGEPLVRSHHGSLASATRQEVEQQLKAGAIRALVTTSSLELGIDMGAIDLVIQVEAPPTVGSALQRIGRAGHQAGAASAGVIVPKFRADLLACAACTRAMHEGMVEHTRYPRNPLDVLAQQIVAAAAMDAWPEEALFALVRSAAPFAGLSRGAFEGVLDMLSGRYPSDAFAELRPRLTWDRIRGIVTAREGARRVAVVNAGTIPDRGLYGVFLLGGGRAARVGELDEEMVFETRVGETFTLGASTWRIESISHDRVLVSPAPGQPGRMPFWHGDQAGRSIELGTAVGALVRELRDLPRPAAEARLVRHHDLDAGAAGILLDYLDAQAASGGLPDDRTVVVERCRDELGDWRLCLLSPFGSRVHAPWAMAAAAGIREATGLEADIMWGDEGFVVRLPAVGTAPEPSLLLPEAAALEQLVLRQVGGTALFAARFREAAARALLLPRRRPGARTPLWRQRKRAGDLLAATASYGSFPMLLETHREILRDHFDLPSLQNLLARLAAGDLRVVSFDTEAPSPFAASLLFSYVAHYIYDGDAPLAERRAQALSVDQAQLRDLMGDAELRELIDADALEALERQLQHLEEGLGTRSADGIHDLLLRLGDLSAAELRMRSALDDRAHATAVASLREAGRVLLIEVAGEARYIAVEDASRYRDGVGVTLPAGVPGALLERVKDAAGDLVRRYARTHGPFGTAALARRYGAPAETFAEILQRLHAAGRMLEGEFRPHGSGREWVDPDVLRVLRQRSLARLRREVEPVPPEALPGFLVEWHGIPGQRQGVDALLDVVEQLQGAPLPASILEREVLPARLAGYAPATLDTLVAAGEVVWTGVEPIGRRDGRIALYRTDALRQLRRHAPSSPDAAAIPAGSRAADVLAYLRAQGASFFAAIHAGTGGGYPKDTVDALWMLVWSGLVTNDTVHALRAYLLPGDAPPARAIAAPAGTIASPAGTVAAGASIGAEPPRGRRLVPPSAQGRWSALPHTASIDGGAAAVGDVRTEVTTWAAAVARQLLMRHGIVARDSLAAEAVPGGFSTLYPVFRSMEEAGRIRRGYFVAGWGGAQFASAAALDLLRKRRDPAGAATLILAAADPVNPYGAALPWPRLWGSGAEPEADASASRPRPGHGPARIAGALIVLVGARLAACLRRNERDLFLFDNGRTPAEAAEDVRSVARALLHRVATAEDGPGAMLIGTINGTAATGHDTAALFVSEGFARTALGLQARLAELKRRGYGALTAGSPADGGTGVAVHPGGGTNVADQKGNKPVDRSSGAPTSETREEEQERLRSSNDRDQARERAGKSSSHNEGYDEAVSGEARDPDSAFSDVDRDDTMDDL